MYTAMSTLCAFSFLALGNMIALMSCVSSLASSELIPLSTKRLTYLLSGVEDVLEVSLGGEVRIFFIMAVHLVDESPT